MNEERIKKELKGLNKVNPPRDFIYQIHSRLEEKPKQFAFPLKLASTVATLIIIFSVYKVVGPQNQLSFKTPGTKMEEGVRESLAGKALRRSSGQAKVARSRSVLRKKVAAKPKPVIKKAPVRVAAAPMEMDLSAVAVKAKAEEAMMGAGVASGSRGMGIVSEDIEKVKYIISLANGKVLYERSTYVVAEIPNAKKDSFIKMISQFDYVKKPAVVETKENSVHYRIKLIPKK